MPVLSRLSLSVRLMVIGICCLATWAYLGRVSRAEIIPPRPALAALSMELDGRVGIAEPLDPEIEAVLGVDEYIVRNYPRAGSLPVGLYVGYHDSQRQGDTMHSPLNCLPGAGWQPLELGRREVRVVGAPGQTGESVVELNRVVIGKGLERNLVYYWYQSHRRVVASEYLGKYYTVVDAIRHNRTDAALVRVIVPIPRGVATVDPDEVAVEFIQQLFPELAVFFPA